MGEDFDYFFKFQKKLIVQKNLIILAYQTHANIFHQTLTKFVHAKSEYLQSNFLELEKSAEIVNFIIFLHM
jgi:hypothetical protein